VDRKLKIQRILIQSTEISHRRRNSLLISYESLYVSLCVFLSFFSETSLTHLCVSLLQSNLAYLIQFKLKFSNPQSLDRIHLDPTISACNPKFSYSYYIVRIRDPLLAISVNRKQISVYLSLMASTVVVADGKYSCRCSDDNSNE
jgi:hypothetical protein